MGRPPAADLLAIAREAAHAGGDVLRERFGGRQQAVARKSSPTDVVGEADLAAEGAIREVLNARRPQDGILAEESGASGDGRLRWVVDPLDGTVNFLYGVPQYAVSVAVEDGDTTLAGVVLDVEHGEEWAATIDGPPTLNGEPMQPYKGARPLCTLGRALVATGFGYDAAVREAQGATVARLLPVVRDVRRAGSAALDLAWTAGGRLDAYYERGVKPWDVAAGALICSRAGLEVRELPARPPQEKGILVAPAGLVDELEKLVA